MQSKFIKICISVLLIVTLCLSFSITTAYADVSPSLRQRFAAGIGAALLGLNITLESTIAPYQQMLDYMAEPLNTVIEYTYPQTNWEDEILDRSLIQIWDEYTEIDGVKYTDVWLSNEAAEKFRVNAFDFATGYSIASNTNGTYASGVGYLDGSPAFLVGASTKTQNYITNGAGTFNIGNTVVFNDSTNNRGNLTLGNGTSNSWGKFIKETYKVKTGQNGCKAYAKLTDNNTYNITATNYGWVEQAFDFDYVAGTIPADQPLPSDQGMMIRVPSDDLRDYIDNHPVFQNNAPVDIDFELNPELKIDLDDLFDVLVPILATLNTGDITFVENHDAPQPTDTLLPDTWFSQLRYQFDRIINAIDNISFDNIIQSISTIPQTIQNGVSNITQAISNLGDSILQDIEEGPIRIFDKVLDLLKTIFLPILTTLKGFLGIWHYVVTWISNITAPFTWTIGMMAGTSNVMMSPIYACIAGFIVIAVYKRFGR